MVLIACEYNVSYNWNQYLVNINKLCKICNIKKITLYVSCILYSNHTNETMQKIYKINQGLYNILNGYKNCVYIDVNKIKFNKNNFRHNSRISLNKKDKECICKLIKYCNMTQNMTNLRFIENHETSNLKSNTNSFFVKSSSCMTIP